MDTNELFKTRTDIKILFLKSESRFVCILLRPDGTFSARACPDVVLIFNISLQPPSTLIRSSSCHLVQNARISCNYFYVQWSLAFIWQFVRYQNACTILMYCVLYMLYMYINTWARSNELMANYYSLFF